jgi:hypothetical protein
VPFCSGTGDNLFFLVGDIMIPIIKNYTHEHVN